MEPLKKGDRVRLTAEGIRQCAKLKYSTGTLVWNPRPNSLTITVLGDGSKGPTVWAKAFWERIPDEV